MARNYQAEEEKRNAKARARGFSSRAQERRVKRQNEEWSDKHASQEIAKWRPRSNPEDDYTKAYYDAFVNPKTSFKSLRRGKSTTPEIYHYFVDVMHYMTSEEYDQKYGAYVSQWHYEVHCRLNDGFSRKLYFDQEDAYGAAIRHTEVRGPRHICTITRTKA
jgi:hypothetical protein